MTEIVVNPTDIEVRGFGFLKQIFDQREWAFPMHYRLEGECTAKQLAEALDLPLDKIEAVFINGLAHPLEEGLIKPGDRVAFLPPGTPGPYRVFLGIKELPGEDGEPVKKV